MDFFFLENEDQTKTKRRIFWRELAEVEGITIDEIRQHVLTLIMSVSLLCYN